MSKNFRNSNTDRSNSPYDPSAERCRKTPYKGRAKAIERVFQGFAGSSRSIVAGK